MATKKSPQKADPNAELDFMKGVTAFFYEAGIGKKRIAILCKQLRKFGGSVLGTFNDRVTHVVMSKTGKLDKLLKSLNIDKFDDLVEIVDADWLSACFLSCKLCDVSPYLMKKKESPQNSNFNTEEKGEVIKTVLLVLNLFE